MQRKSCFFLAVFLVYFFNICNVTANYKTKNIRNRLLNEKDNPSDCDGEECPPDQWFIQDLDHFNPAETQKWKQRYFTNHKYFKNTGPVFLMIDGEGPASPEFAVKGQWIHYAQALGALCFQLEHRYYGKSHPAVDLGTKNLVYLTSEQALADAANFIASKNEEYMFDSSVKWIVFGGSYSGNLAAWMRLKYPHLVHGSVSSSSPLLAKVDFTEYYNVVVESLRTSSEDCVDAVKRAMNELKHLLEHRIGQKDIDNKFKLCDPISLGTKLDISSFFGSMAEQFGGVVQYNKDNRLRTKPKISAITIDVVCRLMTDKTAGNEIDRLANVNALLLDAYEEKCLDYKYQNAIESYRNVSYDNTGNRQWFYQTCNEFGYYQTSEGEPQIFTNNFGIDYFLQQCVDVFGAKFNSDYINNSVKRTNIMYGALGIDVNRVIFVHGSIDPWHALGILKTKDNNAPAIYIEGTAHCANMNPPRDSDLPELKAARGMILELIKTWLDV